MRKPRIIVTLLLLPVVILGLWLVRDRVSDAEASEHLSVDFGVPVGEPVFEVSGFLPGDCTSRSISVTNNTPDTVNLAVRGDNEVDVGFSAVLVITITEGGNPVYADSLDSFFTDSKGLDGVVLSPLSGGADTEYLFELCMDGGAGNGFQSTQVTFDLVFGEAISPFELPAECSHLAGTILFAIEGTDGADRLRGSSAPELLVGFGGNDRISGGGGSDCIVGGDGNDRLDGGSGEDVIVGGTGSDDLRGGSGDDRLFGEEGNDRLRGGSGEDFISGGPGDDDIDGGSGNDELHGDGGFDTLDGSSGTDTCLTGEDLDSCEL